MLYFKMESDSFQEVHKLKVFVPNYRLKKKQSDAYYVLWHLQGKHKKVVVSLRSFISRLIP